MPVCHTSLNFGVLPSLIWYFHHYYHVSIQALMQLSLLLYFYLWLDSSIPALMLPSLLWFCYPYFNAFPLLWCFFHSSDSPISSLLLIYIFCHIHTSIVASIFVSMLLCLSSCFCQSLNATIPIECFYPCYHASISALMLLSLWLWLYPCCHASISILMLLILLSCS